MIPGGTHHQHAARCSRAPHCFGALAAKAIEDGCAAARIAIACAADGTPHNGVMNAIEPPVGAPQVEKGVHRFTLIGLPLNLIGAEASPVRAVALC